MGVCDGTTARRSDGTEAGGVFRFLSEDWSLWIALVRMRERWPGLRFEMKAGYLQAVEAKRTCSRLATPVASFQKDGISPIAAGTPLSGGAE